EARRVSVSSADLPHGYTPPGDAFDHGDDFPNGVAAARSQIESSARSTPIEVTECCQVGFSKIGYVKIITNCGSVRCFVIGAKNLDSIDETGGRRDCERNQVRFRLVILP